MSDKSSSAIITSRGIVLSRRNHGERDLKLHVFLRQEGKVIATVKAGQNTQSKLKSLQEPFILADYQVYLPKHAVFARILNGKLIQSHHKIRQNLAAFLVASQLCEMIELLFPFRAPAPDIFDILQLSFQALHNSASPKTTWLWFTINLLKSLGHGDKTAELATFIQPTERERIQTFLKDEKMSVPFETLLLSPVSIERSQKFMEGQLMDLLPREMKSSGFEKILEPLLKQ